VSALDDLFGAGAGVESSLGKAISSINESMITEMVAQGKMPVEVLDHLGHTKHNIYSPACQYCTRT
jgi:hypothetical protein